MSFLKKLFGLGGGGEAASAGPDKPLKQIEHNGYLISATPYKAEGQYQTCGTISKEIGGTIKEHRFVRADRFSGLDDAVEVSIKKGIQPVEEQGERMFRD